LKSPEAFKVQNDGVLGHSDVSHKGSFDKILLNFEGEQPPFVPFWFDCYQASKLKNQREKRGNLLDQHLSAECLLFYLEVKECLVDHERQRRRKG
jgi:hypothetical protein